MINIGSQDLVDFRKSHNKITDVQAIIEKYEENKDFKRIISQIRTRLSKLDYDNIYVFTDENGNEVNVKNLTTMFIFEYIMGIQEITQHSSRGYNFEEVLDQLTRMMGRFRLSKLDVEKDEDIYIYRKTIDDDIEPQKKVIDIQEGIEEGRLAGAQVFKYYEKTPVGKKGNLRTITAMFDTLRTEPTLDRIRQVVFHEFNHSMEIVIKDKDDIMFDARKLSFDNNEYERVRSDGNIFLSSGRKFLNYEVMENGKGIFYTGLTTREKVRETAENRTGINMHNQITEGAVELISRRILQNMGIEDIDYGKYSGHVRIIERLAKKYGDDDFIVQFLRDSSILIKEFEDINVDGQDGLHYLSEYVDRLYRRMTRINKSEKPFVEIAKKLNLSSNIIKRIGSSEFWSMIDISEDTKRNVIESWLVYVPEQMRDQIETELSSAIDGYKAELEKETEFIDVVTSRMNTRTSRTVPIKNIVMSALENQDKSKKVDAIDVGNTSRTIKLSQQKLFDKGDSLDER